MRLDLLDHLLQALLEIAAIARSREQRAHVEGIYRGPGENVGHLALVDLARQPLGDRGLADAGITNEKGVVLLAAAQHLNGTANLVLRARSADRSCPASPSC